MNHNWHGFNTTTTNDPLLSAVMVSVISMTITLGVISDLLNEKLEGKKQR
jgi:hypothetical protein